MIATDIFSDLQRTGVAILGSTGSIGTAALRVISRHPDRFRVVALTGHGNAGLLRSQAAEFTPRIVGCSAKTQIDRTWRTGADALIQAATHPEVDIVINAVVGTAGLEATIAALRAGKRVALANKESLVLGGTQVLLACEDGGGTVVPIDSEHSAILQCLHGTHDIHRKVRRLILTASGGPFRGRKRYELEKVTVEDALRHPTWHMGRKITIDSATLANKALEVIEAHIMFGIPYDKIEVVVHPQSIVHSFVEFEDGSVKAQLGVPNMEIPILYALTHPDRLEDSGVPRFDPVSHSPLTFETVDHEAFPALELGITAGVRGGAGPAVFNAANEQAVARFLNGEISFLDIPRVIESALYSLSDLPAVTLEELLDADRRARDHVKTL